MRTIPVYRAADDRYDAMPYRRTGRSGLDLPALSLGLWHNFGDVNPLETQRAVLRRAFDLGITHFDLANNYGPPYGSAEENFGRHLVQDLGPYRDELVISSKAGYDMWPGPYGDGGSRKYLLSSLDQSLRRLGLDYVDVFYSHRPDPSVPLEETMGALHTAVTSGKALYAGISNYSPSATREAARILADLGIGMIVFSPLAQGLLTGRYLSGDVPADSRAATSRFLSPEQIGDTYLGRARALNAIAEARGQSLAQLALSWVLRDQRVTSALIGASSVAQLEDNVAALRAEPLTAEEIAAIEPHAVDGTARR
jgi:L-glyceraldehyde 3-phosphate reductase